MSAREIKFIEDTQALPSTDPWDNLIPGETVIVDIDGDQAKVLAVLPGVFLRSAWGDHDEADSWWTVKEAVSQGWKIESTEPAEKTIEVSGNKTAAELRKLADELEAGELLEQKDV